MSATEELEARVEAIEMVLDDLLSQLEPAYLAGLLDDLLPHFQAQQTRRAHFYLEKHLQKALRRQRRRRDLGIPERGPQTPQSPT